MATDEQCIAALEAERAVRIQGFSLGPDFTAPYVLKDFNQEGKEIWRGNMHHEMMERIDIEAMRAALAAVGL